MEGKKVRSLRIKKGLTQEELAKEVSATKQMISQIERGTKSLTIGLLRDLCKVLECEMIDICG